MTTELLYLLLGWLLGLLGPRVIDSIKDHYSRRALATAIRTEAIGLQYRVAITSFLLAQEYGDMSKDYLTWLKPKLINYKSEVTPDPAIILIDTLLTETEKTYNAMVAHMRAIKGKALGLKFFSSSLVDASLESLKDFPSEYQSIIHEFRNELNVLNQEIQTAIEYHRMTFDSSLSKESYAIVSADLEKKYAVIQKMCIRVTDKLQAVMDFNVKNI